MIIFCFVLIKYTVMIGEQSFYLLMNGRMKSKQTILKKQLLELVLIRGKIKRTDVFWKTMCCTCSIYTHWTNLQWWHFIPQAKGCSTKFELDNVNAQCSWCNWKANHWEQYKHWLYIDNVYWEWRADELHKQSRSLRKWKVYELEEAIEEVENKIIWWYKNQTNDEKEKLIQYIIKNSERKRKCKRVLNVISLS